MKQLIKTTINRVNYKTAMVVLFLIGIANTFILFNGAFMDKSQQFYAAGKPFIFRKGEVPLTEGFGLEDLIIITVILILVPVLGLITRKKIENM